MEFIILFVGVAIGWFGHVWYLKQTGSSAK